MEAINSLLNNLDITKWVPDLDKVMSRLHTFSILAMLAGPIIMLVFGLLYFFKPPKEANYKFGFRTYYGMGSVEAWRYTQRIAGMVWGGLGLLLTIVMGIVCMVVGGKGTPAVVNAAAICLVCQVILMLLAYIGISVVVSRNFDKDGERRR